MILAFTSLSHVLKIHFSTVKIILNTSTKRLVVCVNERLGSGLESCAGSGSAILLEKLRQLLHSTGSPYEVTEQVCLGRCAEGIVMRIAPGGPFFTRVTEQDLTEIVQALIAYSPLDKA